LQSGDLENRGGGLVGGGKGLVQHGGMLSAESWAFSGIQNSICEQLAMPFTL
jgi:hypothetical protein